MHPGFPRRVVRSASQGISGADARIPQAILVFSHLTHYVDNQGKGIVPFTPAVQLYYAFEEALNELLEEGVANRFRRYKRAAVHIRERMAKLGVKTLLSSDSLSNTITAFHLPPGISWRHLA